MRPFSHATIDRPLEATLFAQGYLGPARAEEWSRLIGREEAISACEMLSDERKRFLISRLSYWDEWSQKSWKDKGIIYTGDRE